MFSPYRYILQLSPSLSPDVVKQLVFDIMIIIRVCLIETVGIRPKNNRRPTFSLGYLPIHYSLLWEVSVPNIRYFI